MQKAKDEKIFKLAQKEDRIIVSADTDFGFILATWHAEKPSLILFRHFSTQPNIQLKAVLEICKRYSRELNEGSVLVVETGRVRISNLPLV